MLNKGRKGVYSFVFGAITVSVVTPRSIEVINFSYEGIYKPCDISYPNIVKWCVWSHFRARADKVLIFETCALVWNYSLAEEHGICIVGSSWDNVEFV